MGLSRVWTCAGALAARAFLGMATDVLRVVGAGWSSEVDKLSGAEGSTATGVEATLGLASRSSSSSGMASNFSFISSAGNATIFCDLHCT